MAEIKHHKVVASLPNPLEANSIYYVRVGQGYDQYVTNGSGTIVAYQPNAKLELDGKVDKEEGKGLSSNDYTTAEKNKLAGIEVGAQVNTVDSVAGKTGDVALVKADVGLSNVDNTSDANKPISTATAAALNGKVDKVSGKQLSTEDYTTAEKNKLAGVEAGAQVNVATNIGQGSRTSTTIPLTSSTGTGTTLPSATTSLAGLQSAADKAKLDGIATGATKNATDAQLRDRATHTGVQPIASVAGLQTALDGKQPVGDYVTDADPRLSDSREWTAAVVPQAEAEAGTATTARKWTAQRVRQAAIAAWNTITTPFTRTVLSRTTAAQVRSDLELGTAATRDVGEGAGQVMQVGAFGLGLAFPAQVFDANEIADTVGRRSGFYPYMSNSGSTNVPHPYVYIQQLFYGSTGNLTQIAYGYNTPKVWVRYRYSGTWSPWAEQLTPDVLRESTGDSTSYPMTQKATTDALNLKANTSTQVIAGTGLSGGGTLAANRTLSVNFGTTAGTVKEGNWMPTWANVTGKPTTFAPSAHTHTLSQITDAGNVAGISTNGSTANYLRGDGTWTTPPNTTYSTMSVAEGKAGTATSARTMRADYLKQIVESHVEVIDGGTF